MASNKKPSIYSDRGNIGTSEELDEYGVWVKSEPQILSQEAAGFSSDAEDAAPVLEESSAGDFSADDFSIDESADSSGAYDGIDFSGENIEIKNEISEDTGISSDESFGTDFDDFSVSDNESASPGEEPEISDPEIDISDSEVEISDSEIDTSGLETDLSGEDLDTSGLEAGFSDSEFDISDSEIDTSNLETGLSDPEFDIPGSGADDLEIPSFDSDDSSGDDLSGSLGDDLGSDDLGGDDFAGGDLSGDDFTSSDLSSDDLGGDDLSGDDLSGGLGDDLGGDEPGGDDFNISAVNFDVPTVKSIENNIEIGEENFASSSGRESDLSTQLLLKIANELSSIRGELSELKKEFSVVRAPAPEGEKHEEHGGFFSEEDDETIALTGDELDNILNTADFTEESGAEESPESEFSVDEEPAVESGEESGETHLLDDDDKMDLDDLDIDIEMPADFGADEEAAEISPDISADISGETDIAASGLDLDEEGTFGEGAFEESAEESAAAEESDLGDDVFVGIDDDDLAIDFDSDTSLDEEISLEADEVQAADEIEAETEITDEAEAGAETETVEDLTEESLDTDMDMDFSDIEIDDEDSEITLSDDFFADPVDAEETEETIEEAIDEIIEEEDLSDNDIQEAAKHSHKELEKLQQEGAKHINFAPDNSSYLEDEDAGFADDAFDLSDAVIDEPELSADHIDDEITEPALDDVETELDMDSLDDLTIDEEDIPVADSIETAEDDFDISGDSEDSLEQVIPEGLETEIEETPVPFDDDLAEEIEVENFDDSLEIPGEDQEIAEIEEPAAIMQAGPSAAAKSGAKPDSDLVIPSELKSELRNILSYMDQLLESLPEEKIEEFARSEYFDSYKKLFKELGLV